MKYEIIKISESHASYRNEVADSEFIGMIPGVCNGWQWEYVNDKGEYGYSSVSYTELSPEDYAGLWKTEDGTDWIHDTAIYGGWHPTGRVVFRGYGIEYYDPDERETFIKDYDPSVEMSYIVGRV